MVLRKLHHHDLHQYLNFQYHHKHVHNDYFYLDKYFYFYVYVDNNLDQYDPIGMIVQTTYSLTGLWEPDVAGVYAKKLAGPCQITFLKLLAGGGATTIELYDITGTTYTASDKRWVMDASTTTNDINCFASPITFDKGVYAVLQQGQKANSVLMMAVIPSQIRT